MIRLWPSTLTGRLTLILLGGLLAAQLLGAAILLSDRASAIYEASGMNAAQRIAGIVRVLDTLSPEQRRLILPALNTSSFRVAFSEPPDAETDTDDESFASTRLRAVLRNALGPDRALRVAVFADGAGPMGSLQPPRAPRAGMMAMMMQHAPPFGGPPFGGAFTVQTQLLDGQWVSIAQRLPGESIALPWKLLVTLGVLLASVIVLSLIAVRLVTRPLAVLGRAAEALGRDIERPPLVEIGPAEVRRTAQAFNTMQGRLVRFLRDRAQMLAAVSHDLKTPITRLRLRAELIDDSALKANVVHDLEEMAGMTRAALDFLRDASAHEAAQPLDVNAMLESLQADAEAMGRDVKIEGAAAAPYPARPQALRRCVGNLIDNAVRYGKRARVRVRDDGKRLEIVVADDGPGIPPDKVEQVFEPFFRLDASRSRESGGVGLGLSIARDIARGHGGSLTLRNRPEGGLEAILSLPR
jgi:signal transduction histidine kinase